MTTTVTVKTHAWPVRVLSFPCANGEPVEGAEWSPVGEVAPNSQQDFYVHSGQDILVQELPLPVADPVDEVRPPIDHSI
jgi:hypothetical protein